jgi:hypothetical protein
VKTTQNTIAPKRNFGPLPSQGNLNVAIAFGEIGLVNILFKAGSPPWKVSLLFNPEAMFCNAGMIREGLKPGDMYSDDTGLPGGVF